ncbi:uncharacterized protein LOC108228311 [Kryptolebias marmoratus]|uniref:uncharacterized protein LOC108228311 n=1 Tax=Kryptolebias marmoratus TaxID=37003 RepID=UPI0007F91E05|nr:uncharacterized protein LOC108228311 [Kryptolebias marmoratus]XP_024858966.1 uncharacterized protein LOC108228311 [Kryptolebias marmoratus]XP_024858967.1 uncharacterized protein LOC108228311 [Kryptolebias marmoratus]XP_024858968.1 uncharacterized protein LOC108228311 [Kryptolebias marmoratus]
MDACNELDIYIPKEAEVKIVPLKSLSVSVLAKMGIPLPDRKSADSPDVVWISPAVMKRKGRGSVAHRDSCSSETAYRLFSKLRVRSNPLQMSFVSSNRTAWELLKNVSSRTGPSKTQPVRQESAPVDDRSAVVIYQERIYLCIRRSTRSQGRPRTRKLKPSSRRFGPSTSEQPSTSSEQDPGSDGRQKLISVAGKAKEAVVLKRKAVSPAAAHRSPPSVKVSRPEPPPQEAATVRGEDEPPQKDGDWNPGCDSQPDSPEQSIDQIWAGTESLGAAAAASSLREELDFKELEDEERIAQLKAKLLQDAALDNLPF